MAEINRRDAFKALAALTASVGMSVTPVTTSDIDGLELILVRHAGRLSPEEVKCFRDNWKLGCQDTALANVKVLVMPDDFDVEFVRSTS